MVDHERSGGAGTGSFVEDITAYDERMKERGAQLTAEAGEKWVVSRLNLGLIGRAEASMAALEERTGMSRQDLGNLAIQAFDALTAMQEMGHQLMANDPAHATVTLGPGGGSGVETAPPTLAQ